MEMEAKEVAGHNKPDDAWFTIHGKVYNATEYLRDHPGGADVLIEAAGTDATEAFDNAGHSEDARGIMESYLVGTLKGYQPKKPRTRPEEMRKAPEPSSSQSSSSSSSAKEGRPLSKLASLGVFALSITAAYYVGGRHPISPPPKALLAAKGHGSGFSKGLLAGAAILAAVDAVLARQFAKLVLGNKSFASYPAHMKVLPKRVEDETALLRRGPLDPTTYSPLPLTARTELAPNVYKFTFALPTESTVLGLPAGQHVAIRADVDGQAVSRSYTPVSNNSDRGVLELVVKVYPDGKLTSGYMAKLSVGDEVLFSGPRGAMRYRNGLCKRIGMVAGGTGITPMFQVIRAICEDDRDLTRASLIYASRTEQDMLLREELDSLARRYPGNLDVYYVLHHPPEDWPHGKGRVTQDLMREKLPAPEADTRIMLCGPPGMVKAAKSSLVDLGFEQPGAAAKMTDQVFIF